MPSPFDKPKATHGNGSLFVVEGLNILSVEGTPREMGLQHGHLLRTHIADGVVPFFSKKTLEGPTQTQSDAERIYGIVESYIPSEFRDELNGIAEGAELSYEAVLRANLYSEYSQILAAESVNAYISKQAQERGGCSSIVAHSGTSSDGRLLHAKNQDYEGAGYWDKNHTLVLCNPERGYRHVKVTTAGLIKANFSVNEHGVTLGGHFLFSLGAGIHGTGYTTLENRIIREASTLDEAIEIIASTKRAGSFAFVITSWKENRSVVVECNSEEYAVRVPQDGRLIMSNVATGNASMAAKDILKLIGAAQNPIARAVRIAEKLQVAENLTVPAVANILGDHFDPAAKQERALGNVVAQPLTVTSAICAPEDNALWIATGTAPVSNNRFLGFNIEKYLSGSGKLEPIDPITPDERIKPHKLRALRCFVEAQICYERNSFHVPETIMMISKAISEDQDEPIYRRTLATLQLKTGDADAARRTCLAALQLSQAPAERAELLLLTGYAEDILGRREEALSRYHDALAQPFVADDPLLCLSQSTLGRIKKFLSQPFLPKDAEMIAISFSGL